MNVTSVITQDRLNLFYNNECGSLFLGNCIDIMNSMESESVNMIFADPPYSIRKADWDCFENLEEYIKFSETWIAEASRILKSNGTMYICGFTEILADLHYPAMKYFKNCKWLIWYYKNKANLGKDWGRSHESILCLRKSKDFTMNIDNIRIPYNTHTLKYPSHPQAKTSQYNNRSYEELWVPNPLGAKPKDVIEIPTTCNGMNEKTPHPTQKPEELVRKLILASSNEGDIVLDPFVGSGTTAVCSQQLKRNWIGIDNNMQYLQWAVNRLNNVKKQSIKKWIEHDRLLVERRSKIK